ncbi:MAG: sulfatase-like hydrolase/transferase [Endomicrobia bacterium]|nr:sulfatase-like hydrolase/transferase [Endomicrobiia bacterium]
MSFQERKHFFVFFIILNFIFTVIISLFYIFIKEREFVELLFLFIAVFSNTFMIYLLFSIVTFLFIIYQKTICFLPVFFVFVHTLNLVDFIIYKFWNFHINSMVLNIIFTPGGIESLNQSWNIKLTLLIVFMFFSGVEIFIYQISKRFVKIFPNLKIKNIIIVLLPFLVIDKLSFAVSSIFAYTPILKNRATLPFYQPFTARRFAERYLGIKSEKRFEFKKTFNKSLNYPKKEIIFEDSQEKYNFLIIVIDSLRYDMLNKEVMPNSYNFSKKSIVFANHYSGGNSTRFGIFSLFYGVYGNYWFDFLAESRGPILINILKKKDYDIAIFSSSKLTFPEFDRTCFVDIQRQYIYDKLPNYDGARRDVITTEKFIDWLNNRKNNKNFFSFIFFDASHGSFDYLPEFEKFKPSYGISLLEINKNNFTPLFNKYKNSIYFDDYLVGKILDNLNCKGYLKNTIIIITGDHGESFFDKGYIGHNHSFSEEEIKVPFIFYHPKLKPSIIKSSTSHIDLVPTLMDLLGVKNNYSDYSQGINIFEEKEREYLVAFSWDTMGIIFDSYTVVLPLVGYRWDIKVHDNKTWKVLDKDYKFLSKYFLELNNKMSEFKK